MTRLLLAAVFAVASCWNTASAQLLTAWIDLNDQIVVSPIGDLPVRANGLSLQSAGGFLVPISAADPFAFLLLNTPNEITAGNLGDPVTFEKPTVLSAAYDFDAARTNNTSECEDVQMFWGAGPSGAPALHRALKGDANVDGKVSFEDFLFLSSNFGEVGIWPDGDFDCDRLVGLPDFQLLLENFGREQDLTPPGHPPIFIPINAATAVPEPNSSCALGIGLVLAFVTLRSWTSR